MTWTCQSKPNQSIPEPRIIQNQLQSTLCTSCFVFTVTHSRHWTTTPPHDRPLIPPWSTFLIRYRQFVTPKTLSFFCIWSLFTFIFSRCFDFITHLPTTLWTHKNLTIHFSSSPLDRQIHCRISSHYHHQNSLNTCWPPQPNDTITTTTTTQPTPPHFRLICIYRLITGRKIRSWIPKRHIRRRYPLFIRRQRWAAAQQKAGATDPGARLHNGAHFHR